MVPMALTAVAAALAAASAAAVHAALRPHIVVLLVDDLGYASLGFSSPTREPLTPTIDALARQGVRLSNFHVYKYCSPSRSALLSGRLPIHVNVQNHDPWSPGGGVSANMTILPEVLRRVGWRCYHVGKWRENTSNELCDF